jgi:hypothetical protein
MTVLLSGVQFYPFRVVDFFLLMPKMRAFRTPPFSGR